MTGVAWSCKIVPLKFLDSTGSGYTSDAIDAVNYAASKQIRLLSNSWGGGGFSQSLRDAIAASGALFIAAAGNSAQNNDTQPQYPSSYDCTNIVSVAATDSTDALAYFSNYGSNSVDLGAPGDGILNQIKTLYIDPGSPWQNGFVESFHSRFRDECLNRETLWTLTEARVVVEDYRRFYNHQRPHSKLGYISPARFAANNPNQKTPSTDPSLTPVGLRPPCVTDGQITHNQL